MKPYELRRDTNQEVLFEAAYAKHYYEGYCALFESYPASDTRVLLCRRLEKQDKSYRHNLMALYQQNPGEEERLCGYYVTIREVHSEEEATALMVENMSGSIFLRQVMEDIE